MNKSLFIFEQFSKILSCGVLAGDQYETEKLKETFRNEFGKVDFSKFTRNELKCFGFQDWDENLILAPAWIFDYIVDNIKLTSISGKTQITGKDKFDLDTRMGVTAWGIDRAQLRDTMIDILTEKSEV